MAKTRRSKARTPEEQENRLINLANSLAEEKLRNGTASSQLICQILALGSEKKRLENEKLKKDIEVADAKIKQLESNSVTGELYKKAIAAFQRYSGRAEEDIEDMDDIEDWDEDYYD